MKDLMSREKELAVRAVHDKQVFIELYEYYFPRIYNYIFARVGDSSAADDITGDVFEKIVTKIDKYKPECGRFSTWIFTIAQNEVTDYHRKRKKSLLRIVDGQSDISSNNPSNDELLILDEEIACLMRCMSLLSDRDRNVVSLKFWSELSNQEIAEMINESSNHVAVILYRAIKRLKMLMKEKGY